MFVSAFRETQDLGLHINQELNERRNWQGQGSQMHNFGPGNTLRAIPARTKVCAISYTNDLLVKSTD